MSGIKDVVKAARLILTEDGDVTDLVPESKISFGNSPQKAVKPRIVIEVSGTTYSPTFYNDREAKTYTIDYAIYSNSVGQCATIMETVQAAIASYPQPSVQVPWTIRLVDETFQAEVDGVLVGVVSATFQTS